MSKKGSGYYDGFANGVWDDSAYKSGNVTYAAPLPKCFESHPIIQFEGCGKILGASCSKPKPGFDIYVGLDGWMTFNHQNYPWNNKTDPNVEEIHFEITDGSVPQKGSLRGPRQFVAMIDWLTTEIKAGKSLHVGCIGGHGRTGLVLAALCKTITGNEDAINFIRENHCKKAVENEEQVNFLHQYYGIKQVMGSRKLYAQQTSAANRGSSIYHQDKLPRLPASVTDYIPGTHIERSKGPRDLVPPKKSVVSKALPGKLSIWGLTNSTDERIVKP